MAQWSSGDVWEPHPAPLPDPYEPSVWGAIDPGVSYPDLIIGSLNRCSITASLSWETGRSWWFDPPEPGNASAVLYGRIENIAIGDRFVVSAEPNGVLWTGKVDDVSFDVQPDGTTTTVTASDWFAALAGVKRKTTYVNAADLAGRVAQLAGYAGAPQQTSIAPSESTLPLMVAETADTSKGLVDYIATLEEASNGIVSIDADGLWEVISRTPLPETYVPVVIPLEGEDCPESGTLNYASPDRLFNSFTFVSTLVEPSATSITKYGRREYRVEVSKTGSIPLYTPTASVDPDNRPVYYDNLLASLVNPLPFGTARIRVANRNSHLIGLKPYAFVSFDERTWQVLGQKWEVEPEDGGLSQWFVTLSLAVSQDELGGRPPVVTPPTPSRETVTVTLQMDRDAYVVKTSGGSNAGNGASDNLLVGLLTDGNLARTLMRPILSLPGKNVVVSKATLKLHTTTQECMTFGSAPAIKVYRNTTSWSEGTYATKCGFATANSVVYPGPSITTTGSVSKTVTRTEGGACDVIVTDIVKAWVAGSPNYGFNIRGSSESSSGYRTEFCARNRSTSSLRPTLVVTYTRDV